MSLIPIFAVGLAAVIAFMSAVWVVSVLLKNASIVDIFWGPAIILQSLVYLALTYGTPGRRFLVISLVSIWGLRLAIHVFVRNRGKGEDFRYRNWRERYGAKYWWLSFFQVFLLQGALSWIVGAPLLLALQSATPSSLTPIDLLGALVWAVGFFFEAVGDAQLARFKADPANAGRLMRTGLWAYSRHPNYFGDAVQWWGLYLVALAAGGGWTIFSPILMTFLLLHVSGVGTLERTLAETKPGYGEYMRTTSAFVPWFPRERST